MTLCIAIHPDDYGGADPARPDASAPRWRAALERAGHAVRLVDVRQPGLIAELRGCHGFMWRWAHCGGDYRIARRLLPVLERDLSLVVYPDQATCWHYDDKIAQAYLFEAHGLPAPRTHVFFDHDAARAFVRAARYPLVLKLATGAGSENVRRVDDPQAAERLVDVLFTRGVYTLAERELARFPARQRTKVALRALGAGRLPRSLFRDEERQHGYALFQEFLAGNAFDTRVTVIGASAFAYRRFNRRDDFRASGSGNFDTNPAEIDEAALRLALRAARSLALASVAVDVLRAADGAPVIGEISYTYVSWMVHACPGHWRLEGEPDTGTLTFVPGAMWPEDAQIEGYLARLAERWP